MEDNKANQINPNHPQTGPGKESGYHGNADKAALDNKSNQQNSNHQPTKGQK